MNDALPCGLIKNGFSVAERRFGVFINGHDDCFGRVGSANNLLRSSGTSPNFFNTG
jgi:hypothetical protein